MRRRVAAERPIGAPRGHGGFNLYVARMRRNQQCAVERCDALRCDPLNQSTRCDTINTNNICRDAVLYKTTRSGGTKARFGLFSVETLKSLQR